MSNEKNNTVMMAAPDERTMSNVVDSIVLRGDLSGLAPKDRARFYVQVCNGLGLNPAAKPFDFLRLNGKEVLYANKNAGDQLAAIHRVNRKIIDGPKIVDLAGTKLVLAVCEASLPNGRIETATATVPLVDPINVLMKAETKAKRRATMSILGLAILDEMELETIPANVKEPGGGIDLSVLDAEAVDEPRQIDPPNEQPASWSSDLADCGTLADVRACWETWRSTFTDNGVAAKADVRKWASDGGIYLTAEGATAVLSTLPGDALRCLDVSATSDMAAAEHRAEMVVTAARMWSERHDAWNQHSAQTVWATLSRAYTKHTGARDAREGAAALKRAMTPPTPPTPPDGTSGPRKASDDTVAAEGGGEASAGAAGDVASADQIATAWSASARGIVEHVNAIRDARHLEASGRAHLRAISPTLRLHALHAYTDRLRVLSQREERDEEGNAVVTTLDKSVAFARVEEWLREGSKPTARDVAAAKVRRAA